MSKYVEGALPFFAENDEKKKLIYQLPQRVKRDTIVYQEWPQKAEWLGGFDGNGNNWPSNRKSINLL